MANTASTATVIDHTSDAGFRTWVAEIIAQLLAVGLTQTADTGQINTGTVTRPGTNTVGGYAIFRFNDTAHSTTPIFIKLEFGTGSAATAIQMFITVGSGSNGSGTINGVVMTRVNMSGSIAPSSTITAYTSRFVYNPTYGFLGMVWKIGGTGSTNGNMAGFFIFRSTDAAGAVTTDSVMLITNSNNTSGSSTGNPNLQMMSKLTGAAYNGANPVSTAGQFGMMPFLATATLYSGNGQVALCFQATPVLGISALYSAALLSEVGIGSTIVNTALVGATTHTFLAVGWAMGSGVTQTLFSGNYGLLMFWE